MKAKFYLGAIAALALGLGFSSCSSEDEPATDQITGELTPLGEAQYMAVRISAPSNGDSRSTNASDAGYAGPADDKEAAVTAENVRFYFFTDDGLPYTMSLANVNGVVSHTNMIKPNTIAVNKNDGKEELTGVLILGTNEDNGFLGKKPGKVVCIANALPERFDEWANIRLSELKSKIVTIPDASWSRFVMTTSTYVRTGANDTKEEIYWTDIPEVFDTMEKAMESPLQIYIERHAAKIYVKGLGTYPSLAEDGLTVQEYNVANAEGEINKVKYSVELTGWRPMFTANRCFLMKNVKEVLTTDPFKDWNNASLFRCFWAITPGLSQFANNTIDIYTPSTFNLGNYNSSDNSNVYYTFENTDYPTASPTTRETKATAIAVRGVVRVYNEDGTAGDPVNLTYWAGTYYAYDDLRKVIANAYNADMDADSQIAYTDVSFVKDNRTDPKLNVKANTYYAKIGENTEFTRFDNIKWWKDGQTSFYATIQHHKSTGVDGDKDVTGVVRNHVYECELNGVIGLGVPGNDLKDPEKDEESWLATRINVLTWKVVKNSIMLQ